MTYRSPRFGVGDQVEKIDWEGRSIGHGMIVEVLFEDGAGQILSVLTSTGLRQEYSHDMALISNPVIE